MFNSILTKVIGTKHERDVKRMDREYVVAINAMEPEITPLSDDELRTRTSDFRQQLAQGAKLDDLLVPAFAVVREAAWRTVAMRPFDVQLMGGIVLHQGQDRRDEDR